MEFKPLKVRGWKLETGEILVLIFARIGGSGDRLELLEERYVKDEDEFTEVVKEAMGRLREIAEKVGVKLDGVYAQVPGSKQA